nr:MAG TPA: hypothetical protein [Caudoviricetes sp.]
MCRNFGHNVTIKLLLTTRNKAPIVGINKVAPLQRVAGR